MTLVRIIREYGFIVDDGLGGSCWQEDRVTIDETRCDTIDEAIDVIRDSGATQDNGDGSFYHPDGTCTVRFRDDYRVAISAYVLDVSPDNVNLICEGVAS